MSLAQSPEKQARVWPHSWGATSEGTGQGIMAGKAMFEGHETAKKIFLFVAKLSYVGTEVSPPGEYGKKGDHQHFIKIMAGCLMIAGIGNLLKNMGIVLRLFASK